MPDSPAMRLNLSADEVLTTTRAVRKRLDFDRPVERSVLLECLEVAVQAPSGSNRQGWQWMFVEDAAKKAAIADVVPRDLGRLRQGPSARVPRRRPAEPPAARRRVVGAVPQRPLPRGPGHDDPARRGPLRRRWGVGPGGGVGLDAAGGVELPAGPARARAGIGVDHAPPRPREGRGRVARHPVRHLHAGRALSRSPTRRAPTSSRSAGYLSSASPTSTRGDRPGRVRLAVRVGWRRARGARSRRRRGGDRRCAAFHDGGVGRRRREHGGGAGGARARVAGRGPVAAVAPVDPRAHAGVAARGGVGQRRRAGGGSRARRRAARPRRLLPQRHRGGAGRAGAGTGRRRRRHRRRRGTAAGGRGPARGRGRAGRPRPRRGDLGAVLLARGRSGTGRVRLDPGPGRRRARPVRLGARARRAGVRRRRGRGGPARRQHDRPGPAATAPSSPSDAQSRAACALRCAWASSSAHAARNSGGGVGATRRGGGRSGRCCARPGAGRRRTRCDARGRRARSAGPAGRRARW